MKYVKTAGVNTPVYVPREGRAEYSVKRMPMPKFSNDELYARGVPDGLLVGNSHLGPETPHNPCGSAAAKRKNPRPHRVKG